MVVFKILSTRHTIAHTIITQPSADQSLMFQKVNY